MLRMKVKLKYIALAVFCLITGISIGQELKPLNELEVKQAKNHSIQLTKDYVLTIKLDENLYDHILTFRYKSTVNHTDTFAITPYGFNFRLFETVNEKDLLLIIEVEYEFTSEYPIYLFKNDEIKKIGYLNIMLDCDSCDVLNYPLSDIVVKGSQNEIEFSFIEDLILINDKKDDFYGKDEIVFHYNINKNEFKIK